MYECDECGAKRNGGRVSNIHGTFCSDTCIRAATSRGRAGRRFALESAVWDGHEILTALRRWFHSGDTGPGKYSLYDAERTWGRVLESYFAKVEGN